jgi:glycosyltransferase involved in cell wall biosynthesis
MKILCLTNMYPTRAEPWYGCFVKAQGDALRVLGLDVSVLSFDGRVERLNYLRAIGRLRSLLRSNHFDLIHAHYGLTGALALGQRRVPVVTTFYGPEYTGHKPSQRHACAIVARRTTPIFVSEEGRRRFRLPDAEVIPSPVDVEFFTPRDRFGARRALGLDESRRYVLLPGRRLTWKGPRLFDAALRRARAAEPAITPLTLDGLSRSEVVLAMNAADVTLMTSRFEGSPITVKESLACMTPVVSVPVGDVPTVIADLPGCAVLPRNAERLAAGVLEALGATRDPRLRRRAAQFSTGRITHRIASVYSCVVGRGEP